MSLNKSDLNFYKKNGYLVKKKLIPIKIIKKINNLIKQIIKKEERRNSKITNLGGGSFSITAEAEVDGSGNPTGNYILPPGLVIVPPTDHNGELKLNVTAIAQDGTASAVQSSASTLSFNLLAQSESAEVDTSNISTTEDTVVAISIEPTKADESGVLTIEISGVPDGATLGTNNSG